MPPACAAGPSRQFLPPAPRIAHQLTVARALLNVGARRLHNQQRAAAQHPRRAAAAAAAAAATCATNWRGRWGPARQTFSQHCVCFRLVRTCAAGIRSVGGGRAGRLGAGRGRGHALVRPLPPSLRPWSQPPHSVAHPGHRHRPGSRPPPPSSWQSRGTGLHLPCPKHTLTSGGGGFASVYLTDPDW